MGLSDTCHIGWKTLVNEMEYARFYIAELPDGNKVIVLIDDALLNISGGKKIRLPVGVRAAPYKVVTQTTGTFTQYFHNNADRYGIEKGTNWYVNVTSKSFHNSYRLPVLIVRFIPKSPLEYNILIISEMIL